MDDNILIEEYKKLAAVSPDNSCDTAKLPDNKPKNRYVNILPCKLYSLYYIC